MLPFIGYHVGDYFQHWFNMGKKTDPDKLPKIFYVNWFRKDEDGKFIWPGYGENSRVLKWIFERVSGKADAVKTAIGYMPSVDDLDLSGLDITRERVEEILSVDKEGWLAEIESVKEHYLSYGDRLPEELKNQLAALEKRLKEA